MKKISERKLTEVQIARIAGGRPQVAEEKIKAVLNALAILGNRDVLITDMGQDEIARLAGLGKKGGASVSHAIRYLQWADYIDVGTQEGSPHLAIFVRFPRWLGMGERVRYSSFDKGSRVWGHPCKWADNLCLERPWVLAFFNALHDIRNERNKTRLDVHDATYSDIASRRAVSVGQQTHDAADILNTWEYAVQVRNGMTPIYYLKRFRPGSPSLPPQQGGFYYEDPPPATVPLPDPGYLGEIPGEEKFYHAVTADDPVVSTEAEQLPLYIPHMRAGSNFQVVDQRAEERPFVPYKSTGVAGADTGTQFLKNFFRHVERDAPRDALDATGTPQDTFRDKTVQEVIEDAYAHHGPTTDRQELDLATDQEYTRFLLDMARGERTGQVGYLLGLLNRLLDDEVIELHFVDGWLKTVKK